MRTAFLICLAFFATALAQRIDRPDQVRPGTILNEHLRDSTVTWDKVNAAFKDSSWKADQTVDSVLNYYEPRHSTKAPDGWYREYVTVSADSNLYKIRQWYNPFKDGGAGWVTIDTAVTQLISNVTEVLQTNLVFYVDYFRQYSDSDTDSSLERVNTSQGELVNMEAGDFSASGLFFDGTNERITHDAALWNPDSNDWIMQIAVLPKDTKTDGMQIFRSHDGTDGYAFGWNSGAVDDHVYVTQWFDGAGNATAQTNTYNDTTNWQMYTFARHYYDGSNDRLSFYLNNSHTAEASSGSKSETATSSSSSTIYIANNGGSTYWKGYIGFIAVYKAPTGNRWTQDSINTYIDYNYDYFLKKKP